MSPSCCARGSPARPLPPFRYRDYGIAGDDRPQARGGRRSAGCKLTGFLAWLLWSVAHIYFLIGFRNRLAVALHWLWNYVTFQRGTRLITGVTGSRMEDMADPRRESSRPPMRGAA